MQQYVMMGEVALGFSGDQLISLGLGSCVGVILYEPGKKIAMMGHIMLSERPPGDNHHEGSILLAAPAGTMAASISGILSRAGYQNVHTSCTREDALREYMKIRPAIVLVGLTGEKESLEFTRLLINEDKSANVIAIAHGFQKDSYLEHISAGAHDVIVNPYDEESLILSLQAFLGNSLKYADTMVPYMISKLSHLGIMRQNIVAKLAGGSQMFMVNGLDYMDVGPRNVKKTLEILEGAGIRVLGGQTGGSIGRSLTFDVQSEKLTVKTKETVTEI